MAKQLFRTKYNYDFKKQYATVFTIPSETKPDMALTVPEMLKRFRSGRSIDVAVYDDYSGDDDNLTGVDARTLDLSQIHDIIESSSRNVEAARKELAIRRQKELDEKLEQSIIEKHEARKASIAPKIQSPNFIQTSILDDPKSGSNV